MCMVVFVRFTTYIGRILDKEGNQCLAPSAMRRWKAAPPVVA
jgi:hypothetical protein